MATSRASRNTITGTTPPCAVACEQYDPKGNDRREFRCQAGRAGASPLCHNLSAGQLFMQMSERRWHACYVTARGPQCSMYQLQIAPPRDTNDLMLSDLDIQPRGNTHCRRTAQERRSDPAATLQSLHKSYMGMYTGNSFVQCPSLRR